MSCPSLHCIDPLLSRVFVPSVSRPFYPTPHSPPPPSFPKVGKPPFETSDIKLTYKRIRANHYSFPPDTFLSDYFKGLVLKILQLKPEYRPSLEEIERRYG